MWCYLECVGEDGGDGCKRGVDDSQPVQASAVSGDVSRESYCKNRHPSLAKDLQAVNQQVVDHSLGTWPMRGHDKIADCTKLSRPHRRKADRLNHKQLNVSGRLAGVQEQASPKSPPSSQYLRDNIFFQRGVSSVKCDSCG